MPPYRDTALSLSSLSPSALLHWTREQEEREELWIAQCWPGDCQVCTLNVSGMVAMEHPLSVVCSASGHKHHYLCYGGGCVTGARREFFLEFKGDFCNVAIDSSPRINGSVGCSFFAKSEIGRYMETLHLYISLPVYIFWTNTQFSRCFLLLWPYFLVTRSLLNTLWFIWVVSKDMLISKVLGKVPGDFHYTTYHVLHEENRHSGAVYGS